MGTVRCQCQREHFLHTLKWKKILEESFAYDTEYLVVRDESGHVAGTENWLGEQA